MSLAGADGAISQAVVPPVSVGDTTVAGTYEVLVCEGACVGGRTPGNVAVRGHLVLEDARFPFSEVPEPAHSYLERYESLLIQANAEEMPNACFVLARADRAKGFAGLTPVGFSLWVPDSAGVVVLSLYQSPDAGYVLRIGTHGRELGGTGRSWGVGDAEVDLPADSIIGRRIGPPDRSLCIRAAEYEAAHPRLPPGAPTAPSRQDR
jgi:hypothetical protein